MNSPLACDVLFICIVISEQVSRLAAKCNYSFSAAPHSRMQPEIERKQIASARDKAAALKNKLRPMLAYLGKLKRRMVQRGFLNEDPLLKVVVDAENTVHALHVQVARQRVGGFICVGAGDWPGLQEPRKPLMLRSV